jgi:hypothetical protein
MNTPACVSRASRTVLFPERSMFSDERTCSLAVTSLSTTGRSAVTVTVLPSMTVVFSAISTMAVRSEETATAVLVSVSYPTKEAVRE